MTRLRLLGMAAASAVALVLAGLAPAAEASTASLSANVDSMANVVLSQSSGLTSGQTITVTGTGFEPGVALYVVECNADEPAGGDCNIRSPLPVNSVMADSSGDWSVSFPVVSSYADGNTVTDCLEQTVQCAIQTSDGPDPYDFSQELTDPISFAQTSVDSPATDMAFAGTGASGAAPTTAIDGDLPTSVPLTDAGQGVATDANGDVAFIGGFGQVELVAGSRSVDDALWDGFSQYGLDYPSSPLGVGPVTPGDIYLVAGGGGAGQSDSGDGGPAVDASLDNPHALAFDHEGNLLIGEYDGKIRVVADRTVSAADSPYGIAMTAGDIYTIAGGGTPPSDGSPPASGVSATQAGMDDIESLAVDANGDILAADRESRVIWGIDEQSGSGSILGTPVSTRGDAYVVAGSGADATDLDPADGTRATSAGTAVLLDGSMALDPDGDLVYTSGNGKDVDVIAAASGTFYGQAMTAGDIYTVAGDSAKWTGTPSGDGGPALQATFGRAEGVAVDSSGNILVIDENQSDNFVSDLCLVAERSGTFYGQATTAGDIYTVAGAGQTVTGPWAAGSANPSYVAVDLQNDLFVGGDDELDEIIGAAATITAQPSAEAPAVTTPGTTTWTIGSGQPVTLSATATGDPTPSVQWQSSSDGTTWADIPGATTPQYTTPPVTEEGYYRAVFTNTYGTATSDSLLLTVAPAPTVTSISPSSGPAAGGTKVTITGTNLADGDTVDFGTAPATQVSAASSGDTLQATAPAGKGAVAVTVSYLGNTATSPTRFSYTGGSVATAAPKVTTQPRSVTVEVGRRATFTARASGTPAPDVKWESSTDKGRSWRAIRGATSGSYAIARVAAADNGREYRAVFTSSAGSATSKAGKLTVVEAPRVTTQPRSVRVRVGKRARFTARASGLPAPREQWEISTDRGRRWRVIPGARSATHRTEVLRPADRGWELRAVFTNSVGKAISRVAKLTVLPR